MSDRSGFETFCEEIRFPLDEPHPRRSDGWKYLPDLVARVRATGLQVTPMTVPRVADAVARAAQALGASRDPEVYIVANPEANAFAPAFADDRRPIIVLNSGLVSLLSLNELTFAVAHELAHLGLRHTSRFQEREPSSEFEALQVRSYQRYAEISADRVALMASQSVYVAAGVMFKLASGLPAELLGIDVPSFIRQIDRDPDELNRVWELAMSHPSLPFRLWALVRFSHCDVYVKSTGQGTSTVRLSEVDDEISGRFAEMGEGRLIDIENETYTKALVWCGAAMVMEDHRVDRDELNALVNLVGQDLARKAIEFAQAQGREAVMSKLSQALETVSAASIDTRRRLEQSVSAFALSLDADLQRSVTGQLIQRSLKLR